MHCTKLVKLLTTSKNISTILNEKLKFATLPFITDIPQAVAFLVFLGIASSIRESMSASDKSSNFLVSWSHGEMTVVRWI